MYLANDNYKNQVFNVGAYIRLSRDDEDKLLGYSDSILNQKDFLTRFIINNKWCLVDYYIDDGYSGTNFERPGFQRLIRDIESKRVNMVVSKDLSRLGREYIDTGYYVEKFFPKNNIRYIAVTDGIDTFAPNNSCNDMTPFKSVVNDLYARDTSKKVRSVFDSKRLNGQFIGAFAPYGYKKSPHNKNLLIVDQDVAPIVKRIFDMYLAGSGYTHIAGTLNADGVPSPVAYKAQICNYKNPKALVSLWSGDTIKAILKNPTYAGNITQHKQERISYKLKQQRSIPRDKWITVENTHEAIIDREKFDLVQEMISKRTVKGNQVENNEHLLSGFIYCGDCGARMTFHKTTSGNSYAICSNYKRFRSICTRHAISESVLEELVLKELRTLSEQAVNLDALEKKVRSKTSNKWFYNISNEINKIELRLLDIRRIIKKLYEDKHREIITEQDFFDMSREFNNERNTLVTRLTSLKVKENSLGERDHSNESMLSLIKSIAYFKLVDRSTIVKLVDNIIIFNNKVKLVYKFHKP